MEELETVVGLELAAKETQEEYMEQVFLFAGSMMKAFSEAAVESAKRQQSDKYIDQAAKRTGIPVEQLRQMSAMDAKFPILAAMAVATNVMKHIPKEARGKLICDAIDILLLNSELGEESMKQVLYNCIMQVGCEVGSISVAGAK